MYTLFDWNNIGFLIIIVRIQVARKRFLCSCALSHYVIPINNMPWGDLILSSKKVTLNVSTTTVSPSYSLLKFKWRVKYMFHAFCIKINFITIICHVNSRRLNKVQVRTKEMWGFKGESSFIIIYTWFAYQSDYILPTTGKPSWLL